MKRFQLSGRFLRFLILPLVMGGLTSCENEIKAVADAIVVAPIRGAGTAVREGLECAMGNSLDFSIPAMELKLEEGFLTQLISEIAQKKITSPKSLYKKIEGAEALALILMVADNYDGLPELSPIRQRPMSFYHKLLAFGLVNLSAKEPLKRKYWFIDSEKARVGQVEERERFAILLSVGEANALAGGEGSTTIANCH